MGKVSRRKRKETGVGARVAPAVAAAPVHAGPRRHFASGTALVVLTSMVVYANSLRGELLFDDLNAIVNNRYVRELDLGRILTTASWWGELAYGKLYRPLTTLSFALNHALGGLDPLGYHVVNVLLHGAVSWLLLELFWRMTSDRWLSVTAAVLFAVHPVHTEAVASVVGRAEELAALFALASWLFLLRGREVGGRRGAWRLLLAYVCLALGFLAKESAITIIGAVVCADVIFCCKYGIPRAAALKRFWAQYLGLSLVAALLVAWRAFILGTLASKPAHMDNVLVAGAWPARYMTAIAVVARYFGKLVWPFNLAADYSYRQIDLVSSAADLWFLGGMGILAAAGVAVIWGLRRLPEAAFAVTFSAATFSLASNMVVLIGTIMAERLLYLPSAGFCLLAAIALRSVCRSVFKERMRLAASVAAATIALSWAGATWARNRVWRDPVVFFQTMVADAPRSARSHRELGLVYSRLGRHEEALAEIQKSLAIKPRDAATLYNLGNVLMRAARPQDAIAAYKEALERKPDFVQAMTNLANAYSTQGEESSAEQWFRRALLLAPNSPVIHMNLANSLFRQGRLDEAEKHYRLAVSLDPRAANIRTNYGSLLYARGRYREAAEQYREASLLEPASAAGYVGLIAALIEAGETAEAKRVLASAESRFPHDPRVLQMRSRLEAKGSR